MPALAAIVFGLGNPIEQVGKVWRELTYDIAVVGSDLGRLSQDNCIDMSAIELCSFVASLQYYIHIWWPDLQGLSVADTQAKDKLARKRNAIRQG